MTGWLLLYALRVSLWLVAVAMAWLVLRPAAARWRRRLLLVGLAAVPLWAWLPETGDVGWRWLPVVGETGAASSFAAATGGAAESVAAVKAGGMGGDGAGQAWLGAGRALADWLAGVWLLGSGLLALLTLVRWQCWRHREGLARPVALAWMDSVSWPRPPLPVAVLPGLSSPCVSGLLRPRLLVPPEALHWSAGEWRAMVRHEWQHVCQGDLWWGWWMRCLRILLWWHPLLHGLVDRWREESELCCDQAAVAGGGQHRRRAYARLLLRLVEGGGDQQAGGFTAPVPVMPGQGGAMDGAGPFQLRGERCLRRRLELVLQGASPRLTCWQQGGRLLLVVSVLAAGGCGAASRPGVGPEAESLQATEEETGAGLAEHQDQDGIEAGAQAGSGQIDPADEARLRWAAEAFPAGSGPGGMR